MSAIQQAVAQRDAQQPTIAAFIASLTPEIQRSLPKGMDGDRITRLALTCVRKTPELAECSRDSFAGALLTASAHGLEPGVNDEAYLVPYKGEATLIIGYQGYVKLFWQHPLAAQLSAHVVYANDEFEYSYGLNPTLHHKPARGDRGPIECYYGTAGLTTGAKVFVVLTTAEVKALRGGKEGPSGRIIDPMKWMERKTVLRQLFKLLPKSVSMAAAIAADERPGSELHRELMQAAAPALQVLDGDVVDSTTGEITSGPTWPATAQPADA